MAVDRRAGGGAVAGSGTAQAVWQLHNLGFGDLAQARLRRSQYNQANYHVLEVQAQVAAEITADFRGFICPDKFVVGYGMDMAHQFRELPFVGYVTPAGSN